MLDLPTIDKINFENKNVLVRGDFDVDDGDNPRADSIRNLVELLRKKNASKIKVIGHTETEYDLAAQLRIEFPDVEFDSGLRNDPGEKANDLEFAKRLADGFDVYINESFATSHREHASIVALPKIIKENGGQICVGLRFEKEIENLSKVFANPNPSASSGCRKPVVMVISGVKEDKLSYLESFSKFADKILIGGRLPEIIEKAMYNVHSDNSKDWDQFNSESILKQVQDDKGRIIVASLIQDKEDITIHSMENFEAEIANAGTIVVSGPVGKFEEEGHRQGTERVFGAVINNTNAFKVAGGGDTEEAIKTLIIGDKWDWISVGGGAMLEFLAKGTLPGIEALK